MFNLHSAVVNMDQFISVNLGNKELAPHTDIEPASFTNLHLHMMNRASLRELNKRIVELSQDKMPMQRFRPNLIFDYVPLHDLTENVG